MLSKAHYYTLKASYLIRYVLGMMSRSEYKKIKHFLKTIFYPKLKGYSIIGIGHKKLWYKKNFDSYFTKNKEILHDKYLRLIDGLDDESAKCIQVIISRIMRYCQSGRGLQKIRFEATASEIQMLKQTEEDLHSRVIRFPSGVTAYKKWLLPGPEFINLEPGVFYSKHFIEELDNLRELRSKAIIDVGAYIGDSALVLQDYTDEKVYAFEPSSRCLEILTETIKLNNSNKIIPVGLGLGDTTEELIMKRIVFMNKKNASVKLTTLDEWVKNNKVEVGVIKVDIEGLEQKFLRGAVETIRKYKPALLISIYHSASDMFEIKPFIEELNLGYKFKIRRAIDGYILRDTMLICEVR